MLWLKNLDLFTIVQFHFPNPLNLGFWQVSYLFLIIEQGDYEAVRKVFGGITKIKPVKKRR
jgi:hypothetical protein